MSRLCVERSSERREAFIRVRAQLPEDLTKCHHRLRVQQRHARPRLAEDAVALAIDFDETGADASSPSA